VTDGAPRDEPAEHRTDGERLEEIALTIQRFAALDFTARAGVGPTGDVLDAVAAGVNFLGEELEASYRDIEDKVAERTAELDAASKELAHRALHDELTGLPNRTLFWDRLSQRMMLAQRRHSDFAVLFVDLDKFKLVNDTMGHAAGDRLLKDVAWRIRGALRAGDSAARMGGDEFLILLDELDSFDAAVGVINRLIDTLGAPYEIATNRPTVTISIGAVMGTDGLATAEQFVAAADAAMYEAKQRGSGGFVFYNEIRESRTVDSLVRDAIIDAPVRPAEGDLSTGDANRQT